MKLAFTALVFRHDANFRQRREGSFAPGRRGSELLLRRPARCWLTAHWRVRAKMQHPVCSWSLEPKSPAEGRGRSLHRRALPHLLLSRPYR